MKTNQLMNVQIGELNLPIFHKTQMVDFKSVWNYGNELRRLKGKKLLDLDNYLRQPETLEFLISLERFFNSADSTLLKIKHNKQRGTAKIVGGKLTTLITKRGRYGGTWANLYLLLGIATKMDSDLKVQIYDTFINNKILFWRDESGNSFKDLNIAIDKHLKLNVDIQNLSEDQIKKYKQNIYINVAIKIRVKCGLPERIPKGLNIWNDLATKEQLELRTTYITKIISFLEMDLVKNESHLFKLINKI